VRNGSPTRLLVTGVPCAGKTTFARWLASEHAFTAFLADHDQNWTVDLVAAVNDGKDVILDYGIPAGSIPTVRQWLIQDLGFQAWWFDADPEASLEVFVARQDHPATRADWVRYMDGLRTHADEYASLYDDRVIRTLDSGPTRTMSDSEILEHIKTYRGSHNV